MANCQQSPILLYVAAMQTQSTQPPDLLFTSKITLSCFGLSSVWLSTMAPAIELFNQVVICSNFTCIHSFSIACVDQFTEYRKAYFDTKFTLRNSNYLMYSMITFQGTKKLVNSLLVAYKNIFRKLFKRSCCSKASCCTFVGYMYFESQRLINFASVH